MEAPAPRVGDPTVIVDSLHVEYRSFAGGKRADNKSSLLKRSRGTRVVHALKGVSFVAHRGESIGVIGHNGSGKSTLMRSIAGLTPAASGAVYAQSRPALLGVNAALMPALTGEKNVILGALALGLTPKEAAEKYQDIVDFSEIEEFIDLPMKTYSSGMGARLRFAIAMAREQQILLIDEALAVGDKGFRERSEERIRAMRDRAGTVFLVSHSMGSIRDTCNRVIWIDHGTIRMDGDPKEVIQAYRASK
nr:ABC transporter ATP-binding protein [Demequina salsinemoris]